jgi:hypothetical protein
MATLGFHFFDRPIMPAHACPKCSGEMVQTDKNTCTGEVWREFTCRACGHVADVNEGVALWKIMQDGMKEDKKD